MFGKYAIGLLFVFVASAWSLADPTLAQDETGSDFTFRRVKPPTSGTQKRITVSIDKTWPYDYAAPERKSSPAVLPDIAPHEPTGYDWFWSAVSPNLAAASPDRLDTALRALNGVADADKRTVAPDVANIEAIIAHEYFQVNLKVTWSTVKNNLPTVIEPLKNLLRNLEEA